MKMPTESEKDMKTSYSYFALIPIFKGRKKSNAERNIIQIIHKSNIFKSNPILKTLLIENVRITCIVVESSGKQSIKILCASVPYILSLISKANPKFEKFLKSENVSSCLKYFSEKDFEYMLNNLYHATIILHNGYKKLYPAIYVSFIKDSIPNSEKFLFYLVKLFLSVLHTTAEFISGNISFLFQYLRQQNYKIFTYVFENFPLVIASFIKYTIIATENVHKAVFIGVRCIKNFVVAAIHFLNDYSESALCYSLKKLYLFLNLISHYLRTTDTYNHTEQAIVYLYKIIEPYLWEFLLKLIGVIKHLWLIYVPYMKDIVHIIVKETVPYVRKFIDDNWETILDLYNEIKTFLFKNTRYIKPLCCRTCLILYDFMHYTYNILQAILPHIIQFSSSAAIFFATTLMQNLEHCVYFCKILFRYIITAIENQRHNFCHFSKNAVNILKQICKIVLKIRPYMVIFSQTVFHELSKVIRILSPMFFECIQEVNSSLFSASKEIAGKSCLAVKRVTPSFYFSVKKFLPPTILAVHELLKSSKNSIIIVSPALLKFALKISPEVKEGIVILMSDGNKACIEVIAVSYSASCQIKNVAVTVSSNIPMICKAAHEVLITTAYATVEVTNKSLSAKSRLLTDIKRARRVVKTSCVLAEKEVVTVYNDLICEVDTFFPRRKETDINKTVNKHVATLFHLVSSNIIKRLKVAVYELEGMSQKSLVCFQKFSKFLINAIFYILFLSYTGCMDIVVPGILHIFGKKFFITSHMIHNLCSSTYSCISNNIIRILECILTYTPKAWHSFKSNVSAIWNKICLLSPQLWTLMENLISEIWDFITEHVPTTWGAWKRFCFILWKLTQDLTPQIWQCSSTITSVLWPFGRAVTKQLWCLFTYTSSFTWEQVTSSLSQYWLLSRKYLPRLWYIGCKKTKTAWIATCYLIENGYDLTVESCSISWNFLHCTVSKSWKSGVVFTKTAYCMFTTAGSVLQRSFYVCSKTVLKSTSLMNDFSFNSFRILKLQKFSGSTKNQKLLHRINISN